ncbi:MAG TPA: S1 family peptidase [Pseudonocardiaceae bacterium]|nr:S1 family peptidase [Pseudonocardiaceae bacterium]
MLAAPACAVLLSLALAVPSSADAASFDQRSASLDASLGQVGAAQVRALGREAGLSVEQAQQRLVKEAAAGGVVTALRSTLGGSFAGAWFEPGSPDLVAATTDPAAVPRVRAAGAVPRVVSLDLATLHRVMAALDSRADRVPDAVTGWHVDPASNSVVVSATDPAAAETFVAGQPGVRVEQVAASPVPLADLRGGGGIESSTGARCSIGFNATGGGVRYVITAGHCTKLGGTWSGDDGTPIGPVARTSFPGNDFGLISVTSPSWRQTPNVITSSGSVRVTGVGRAQLGASICRAGSTTGYQCGIVQAVDETVNYGGGEVVSGLTRTSACAEAGDSGGSFISGSQALGILSGGSGSCFLDLLGAESYFQPIGEALAAYNLALVTN